MGQGHPYVRELAKIRDVSFVDLPTGHWPQFTRPSDLGQAILASVWTRDFLSSKPVPYYAAG